MQTVNVQFVTAVTAP